MTNLTLVRSDPQVEVQQELPLLLAGGWQEQEVGLGGQTPRELIELTLLSREPGTTAGSSAWTPSLLRAQLRPGG